MESSDSSTRLNVQDDFFAPVSGISAGIIWNSQGLAEYFSLPKQALCKVILKQHGNLRVIRLLQWRLASTSVSIPKGTGGSCKACYSLALGVTSVLLYRLNMNHRATPDSKII